jgi:amino acid permease
VWIRRLARVAYGLSALVGGLAFLGGASADPGETNLQQTQTLFWVMVGISAVGAIITWSVMAYAIWKFRDPKVKGRRYG